MPESSGSVRPVTAERELARLDRWSFQVLPGDGIGCDKVVMGTTGAFAVVFAGDAVPSGVRVPGVRRARRAARKLKSHLGAIGIHGETLAVVCPQTDSVFAPRTVRGVRVVPPVLLAGEISGRNRAILPHQVKRAAEALTRSFAQFR
jgi:hypothetical protein